MRRKQIGLIPVLIACFSLSVAAQDIFSDGQIAIEQKKLERLSKGNRAKIGHALTMLEKTALMASSSNSLEVIAAISNETQKAVDRAAIVTPDGILRGSLLACNKALGHSYFLRAVNAGVINSNNEDATGLLEEIMLRYQLANIPSYERAARVMDFANGQLSIAKLISSRAGITPETRRGKSRKQTNSLNNFRPFR